MSEFGDVSAKARTRQCITALGSLKGPTLTEGNASFATDILPIRTVSPYAVRLKKELQKRFEMIRWELTTVEQHTHWVNQLEER